VFCRSHRHKSYPLPHSSQIKTHISKWLNKFTSPHSSLISKQSFTHTYNLSYPLSKRNTNEHRKPSRLKDKAVWPAHLMGIWKVQRSNLETKIEYPSSLLWFSSDSSSECHDRAPKHNGDSFLSTSLTIQYSITLQLSVSLPSKLAELRNTCRSILWKKKKVIKLGFTNTVSRLPSRLNFVRWYLIHVEFHY